MELFEFNNQVDKTNKLLAHIKKEYSVQLSESTVGTTYAKSERKMNWMRNNLQDNMNNPSWVRESLICEAIKSAMNILEAKQEFRVDPKTGALLNYKKPHNGDDSSVSARPDLYWRNEDHSTSDAVVIPMPLNNDELALAATNTGTKRTTSNPQSTGMYVGVDTPGAQAAVVNNKKGNNKVVKAKLGMNGVVDTETKDQASSQKKDGSTNNVSPFSNKRGSKEGKYKTEVKSTISGSKEQKKMNEGKTGNHMLMLVESEIEKAQIVMAVQNEIVEKMQRDAEKMANMKIDVLGPIVERIKAEHGLDAAETFRDTITRLIDQSLDVIMQVKDQIHTETLKLTGDVSSAPSIEQDLGAEEPVPEFGMDDEFSADEPVLDDPLAEPMPAEREVKESAKKIGLVLESKSGTIGKKFFTEGVEEMRSWVKENKDKIAKIHKII